MSEDPTQLDARQARSQQMLETCRRELAQVRLEQEACKEQLRRLAKSERERAQLASQFAGWLSDAFWTQNKPPASRRQALRALVRELVRGRRATPVDHRLHLEQIALLEASPLFDGGWYLWRYPDVAASGRSPAVHYLLHGASEGRNPGPRFDSKAYLRTYPDVAETGQNPLLHYIQHGMDEGRAIQEVQEPVDPLALHAGEAVAAGRAESDATLPGGC